MGEKVDRLVSLSRVFVPAHASVSPTGKIEHVDAYWRTGRSVSGRQLQQGDHFVSGGHVHEVVGTQQQVVPGSTLERQYGRLHASLEMQDHVVFTKNLSTGEAGVFRFGPGKSGKVRIAQPPPQPKVKRSFRERLTSMKPQFEVKYTPGDGGKSTSFGTSGSSSGGSSSGGSSGSMMAADLTHLVRQHDSSVKKLANTPYFNVYSTHERFHRMGRMSVRHTHT